MQKDIEESRFMRCDVMPGQVTAADPFCRNPQLLSLTSTLSLPLFRPALHSLLLHCFFGHEHFLPPTGVGSPLGLRRKKWVDWRTLAHLLSREDS